MPVIPTCNIGNRHSLLQTLDALTTMSRAVSHDYNNLLNAISGNLFLLQHAKITNDTAQNSIQQMDNCTNRALELTSKIKIFTGNTKIENSTFSLNKLIKETCTGLAVPHIKIPDITCKSECTNIKVTTDKTFLTTVLQALVTNAAETMIERPGEITVSTKQIPAKKAKKIPLTYPAQLAAIDYVCISIKDTGKGISLKNQQKIFNPFFTTKMRGEGLGLSVVFGIIKALNGGIIVNSKISKGSTFSVLIPIKN